ncbi:unnamed protein product [Nezara viridula]|uniref:Regulatory protein zeste n=1 Tax=Nezara viridula TaxID=85310 RepID=A0A9P0MMD4_NEZVI|nr:unnamed protein product [Nezara viridula]
MEVKKERARAANFTKEEENLLLRIINNHSDVIEIKLTDSVTNSMKAREWKTIAEEFNAQNLGQLRDPISLRTKYENIKRNANKKLREKKISRIKMEGGPEEIVISDDDETQLLQVIEPKAAGFQYTYGDDDVTHNNRITTSLFMEVEDDSVNEMDTKSSIVVGPKVEASQDNESLEIAAFTTSPIFPHSLATPSSMGQTLVGQASKSPEATPYEFQPVDPTRLPSLDEFSLPVLRTRKRGHTLDKISAWAISKAAIAEQEQIFKKELHEQKKRHLEEEHLLRIKILEQQLRHAEEQQSWLQVEHLEKLKNIKSTQ